MNRWSHFWIATVAFLQSCMLGAYSDSDLKTITDAEALSEAMSCARCVGGVLGYEAEYRRSVVAELARRKGWDDDKIADVETGTVRIGFTIEHVLAARGWPDSRSDWSGGDRLHTSLSYGTLNNLTTFFLCDGVVTGWNHTRL